MSNLEKILDREFVEIAEYFGMSADVIHNIERDVRQHYMKYGPVTMHDVVYAKLNRNQSKEIKNLLKKAVV